MELLPAHNLLKIMVSNVENAFLGLLKMTSPEQLLKEEKVLYFSLKEYPEKTLAVLGESLTQTVVDKSVLGLQNYRLINYLPGPLLTKGIFDWYMKVANDFTCLSKFEKFLTKEMADKLLSEKKLTVEKLPASFIDRDLLLAEIDRILSPHKHEEFMLDELAVGELKVIVLMYKKLKSHTFSDIPSLILFLTLRDGVKMLQS
jgi:hypothetical protein